MIAGIIGMVIGALILGIGIYYSVQSRKEDGKVFGFYKALAIIGAVVIVIFAAVLILTFAFQ